MVRSRKTFLCEKCGKHFFREYYFKKHGSVCPALKRFSCDKCQAKFKSKHNMLRHTRLVHSKFEHLHRVYLCGFCEKRFSSVRNLKKHRQTHMRRGVDESLPKKGLAGFRVVSSAHKKSCVILRYIYPDYIHFVPQAFRHVRRKLIALLVKVRGIFKMIRAAFTFTIEFVKLDEEGKVENMIVVPFRSAVQTLGRFDRLSPTVLKVFFDLLANIDTFVSAGSGWSINDILHFDVEVCRYKPISAGCGPHKLVYQRKQGVQMTDEGFVTEETRESPNLSLEEENQVLDILLTSATSEVRERIKLPLSDGENCFYLSVAQHFVQKPEFKHLSLAKFIDTQLWTHVSTPVKLDEIHQIEKHNQHLDLAINVVYQDEDNDIYPVHVSKFLKASNIIVLLLCLVETNSHKSEEENEGDNGKNMIYEDMHYAFVSSPDKLLAPRMLSARNDSGVINQTLTGKFCFNCFNFLRSEKSYTQHQSWCHQKKGQRVHMPNCGDVVSFKENNKPPAAFTLFFDFEALQVRPKAVCSCSPEVYAETERISKLSEKELEEEAFNLEHEQQQIYKEGKRRKVKQANICRHKTRILWEQEPFSYAFILVDRRGVIREEKFYVGMDAAEHFLRSVLQIQKKYIAFLHGGGCGMVLTEEDMRKMESATHCIQCEEILGSDRVRDHDHISGRFLGMAHNVCNLQRKENFKIVAFAHAFSAYDSHCLLKAISKCRNEITRVQAIPLNMQKFKCLEVDQIVFLDSTNFLAGSLEKLTETLVVSSHKFPILAQKKWLREFNPKLWSTARNKMARCQLESDAREMLKRKGIYPYSFCKSIRQLENQHSLPSIKDFHQIIGGFDLSESDYKHAQSVWNFFGCETMIDYTRLYNLSDVYLLAEAVLEMRGGLLNKFDLDLCHYLSLPMMTKQIMLKFTGCEMELISDQEMVHMLMSNIRGGLSFIGTRYLDVEELSKELGEPISIAYIDFNNLYGRAMTYPMPLRNFRFMSQEEIRLFDPMTDVTIRDGNGYILEVTLQYPEHLHQNHNSCPLAPEQVTIKESDLSEYSKQCLSQFTGRGAAKNYKAQKLTATFRDRVKYVCHGLNLQLYLSLGMKLVKLHRGIVFFQSEFIKPYIDYVTIARANARTKTENQRMKLLSNSLYGKMIEGVSSRMDCKFNMTERKALKNFSNPLFKGVVICDENLSVTFHSKKEVYMRQSWAVGFSVLEISKYEMFKLFYQTIKPRFGNKVQVLMSDTDSFTFAAPASSSDAIMKTLDDVVDFSNYPKEHPLYNELRKNKLGFIKNETAGDEIVKFAGLRSKTYAYKTRKEMTETRAKGVKEVYKKKISFDKYVKCIQEIESVNVNQVSIRSFDHQLTLIESQKRAFDSFYDKRYMTCPIHSVPFESKFISYHKETGKCFMCENKQLML